MTKRIQVFYHKTPNAPYNAIVSEEDYEKLSCFVWRAHQTKHTVYAYTIVTRKNIYMHRMILGLDKGDKERVDHKNRIGLDNRRSNLRLSTVSQNTQNSKKTSGKTSTYKGVSFVPPCPKIKRKNPGWRAIIYIPKLLSLGTYGTQEEAARAYDVAAREYFGEFARLNFPE